MHHSIDITKLAAAAAHPLSTSTFDHVLNRLQNLTLPEAGLQKHQLDGEALFAAYPKAEERTVIDTFAPRRTAHDRSPTSSQSSSDAEYSSSSNYSASQPASPTAAAHEAFYATRSRVVRLFNLPPMAEAFLSRVFLPQNQAEHRAHIPIPATLWELRDEVVAGRRASSVWAVFRTHEEACAALALSGRAMSVATALESDLEPFHKLHRVLLTTAPTPTLPPPRHLALDLPPPSPSRSRMPELTVAPPMGDYTLSSNPPNPKTSFRLGDWICPSPNCAAHNFGRNLACIGCGCPRSAVNGANAGAHTHNHQHQHQHALNPVGGGASVGQGARGIPSPRFTNNATGNGVNGVNGISGNNSVSGGVTTYYSSGPTPAAAQTFQARPQQTQQNHPQLEQHERLSPHQQQHNQQHQQFNAVFTQTQSSTPTAQHNLQTFRPSSSSTSSSPPISIHAPHTQPAAPVKAAAASASSSSAHPLLTPSGRAFAVGGKVQNISSDPLSPCVMYWPDNEPFPEQGQIRPSCMAGIAPPILNTGNRGPISHQPGDWICQKCNYLNWRRRKVCQTCLPYAEGNGDSISAAVQAERIALLTSVLSQTSLTGGSTLDVPASVHRHGSSPAHGQRSHSLTPPQSRRPFIDLPSAVPGPHASHAQSQVQHAQGSSLQVPHSGSHLGPSLHRSVHRSQSHLALGQQYHGAARRSRVSSSNNCISSSFSTNASSSSSSSSSSRSHRIRRRALYTRRRATASRRRSFRRGPMRGGCSSSSSRVTSSSNRVSSSSRVTSSSNRVSSSSSST
ncbi:hypothetical protein BJ912DRAFT_563945 [Pholiota molesta]|nr:hypothetical protein BJ912DRAFT_563945 [Pholiota molesta]